jgi:hypothetical protein
MINTVYLLIYILIGRFIVIKTRIYWLRQAIALIFGIFLLAFMKTGLVPDSWLSAIIVFPGAIYLAFLPDRLERKRK